MSNVFPIMKLLKMIHGGISVLLRSVQSAVSVPTPAFFAKKKKVYVCWLRFRTVTNKLPHLGNTAVDLASSFLIT